jgi:hypothetical protein
MGTLMIIEKPVGSDLFKDKADLKIIPVNCYCVMGAGLARQCADRYPPVAQWFREGCKQQRILPGSVSFYRERWIDLGFDIGLIATKDHWRDPSRIEWIETGFKTIRQTCILRSQTIDAHVSVTWVIERAIYGYNKRCR